MRHLLAATAGLAVVYALTLASTDPVDLAMGATIGAILVGVLGRRLRLGPGGDLPSVARRALWFPVFVAAVVADVAQGTWDVALRVVHLRSLRHPGVVRVPIGRRSERGTAVSAHATTLSPGTVLIDVDWERRDMVVHVIDASDPDAVRARLQRFYDRYQRNVFP
jgi:multisubunit Na+/H+ antiporter MnhE subunit